MESSSRQYLSGDITDPCLAWTKFVSEVKGGSDDVGPTGRHSSKHYHGFPVDKPTGTLKDSTKGIHLILDEDSTDEETSSKEMVNETKVEEAKAEDSSPKRSNPYDEHMGEHRQYWRDIILGVNDGLVSTFLLVAGVTGAHLSSHDILLTAIAGTIAGAISMATGEYVATKTQEEVMDGEIKAERRHMEKNKAHELAETPALLTKVGIPEAGDDNDDSEELRRLLLKFYETHDEALLQAHIALELGVLEDERRSPWKAGATAFFLFFFGALPSVIPFLVTDDTTSGFIAAGVATLLGLFLVGAIKTWATKGVWWVAAVENLVIASLGGAIAYGIGNAFERIIGH